MLKKLMKKEEGFTLAELLIVVAIIAVLVAISIPIFTSQLEKSREATDVANIRSAYADVMAKYLTDGEATVSMEVEARQKVAGWQTSPQPVIVTQVDGVESAISFDARTTGSYTVRVGVDTSGNASVSIS